MICCCSSKVHATLCFIVCCLLVGVLGVLVGILGALVGVLGVLVGILDIFDIGLVYLFCF